MTGFYLRWAAVIVLASILGIVTSQRYEQNLASMSPDLVIAGNNTAQSTIRVQGMVKSGSLTGNPEEGHAAFEFLGTEKSLNVQYQGPPPDNLRELKTLILIGRWDAKANIFQAHETALVTNYGFVASAYVIAFIVLVVFVFAMSRKVTFLYQEIKDSKLYEPELETHVDQR
ncbi:MAG: cytochrome c maturation protein CcmE [Nitrospirales bacterium]